MRTIIITDLTRFKNPEILCTAGIDPSNSETIRPMPYFRKKFCVRLGIRPGVIIEENFTKHEESARPHVEDHYASGIVKSGYCSEEEFRNLLRASFHSSIAEGFEVEIEEGQKHIKHDTAPSRSLLTIRVNPRTIQIMQSQFDPEKIQISFCDLSNRWFNYLSITDLVLFQHLRSCQDNDKEIQSVKQAIQSSKEVYLRIGLSRIFESSDGRKGYWIQVNGVYPFPDCLDIFQAGD